MPECRIQKPSSYTRMASLSLPERVGTLYAGVFFIVAKFIHIAMVREKAQRDAKTLNQT